MNAIPDEGLVFLDSNIVAYAHDAREEEKQSVAKDLIDELWESKRGAVSTQVLQEFYVVATKKFDPPLSRNEARDLVNGYGQWKLVRIDLLMIVSASKLEEEHQLTFWDALIIEATRRSGATLLISEDIPSATTIKGIPIVNPFSSPPK